MSAVRDYLRAVAADPAGAADAELLARFTGSGDEAAFELLVWRHAALVRRVCRSVLRDHHAAEDAAQAAFLVLARKARTFAGRGAVVGWLYRVARRAAVRLARQRVRLPGPLPHPDRLAAADTLDTADAAEQAARLWAEVDRLPERYRVPVLLCHFEGLTHPEAARRTGWPVGTVAGRLSRARALLARRLTPRGVGLAVAAAGPPAGSFVGATARAAAELAAGQSVTSVSPAVLSLAYGVTRTMTLFPLKLTAAAVLTATGLAAGVWAAGLTPGPRDPGRTADDPPAATAEKPVAGKPADAATRMRVANNLKQILIAIHAYHDANNRFPADIVGKDGKPLLSWRVAILPYIEQDAVYRAFKLDEPWDSENNKQLIRQMPQQYRLPGQPRDDTKTYYQGLAGPGTLFEARKKITLASVTDGTSNTLAVVVAGDPVEWAKPADIPFDPKAVKVPASPYANVLLAAIADGSVRTMGTKITPGLFSKLAVRDDGEVIDPNEFPKPEARATTKEDREYAAKLAARNQELAAEIGRLLEERKKVLAEAVRQKAGPGADIEALVAAQDGLERMIEQLKEENERLKEGGEGRRPTPQSPTPAKPIIKR